LLSVGSTIQGELPQNVVNPAEYGDLTGTPAYIALCGTSMATPVVAGSAALPASAGSNLNSGCSEGAVDEDRQQDIRDPIGDCRPDY
jgi:subtilisin family serine protease